MKKVLFSILAIGVLVFGFIGSTTNGLSKLSADETNCCGHPIQPPI